MEWLSSNETIEILIFLLPGFVAVIVFLFIYFTSQAEYIRTNYSIIDIHYNPINYTMVFQISNCFME